ncbi:filament-like plant protein [Ipomoea triloba]|uniref:filament-like plant protein n=1 Tax=Ipomoea triloba TaxID=35885 RepID=UPI00125D5309|nr:filament-like plant protein [Ipomoea triloba]XP_031095717.1 filament-like plant protein [Ipomoea triloba]XP_031095718.1 filament-like plant protein [Ipomoea triloba]XP_031095719.1 filament-like plant protein [Ipomoea triloba]XP_031095720.1 filament-like plant protein [Ipomoea triloba]
MDRRSWLWRRKSSDKSPSGETESSGSISSHSERFSDDQAIPNHSIQSPEVTSKASNYEELNDSVSVKALSAKLSEALLNIRAKEDLVKQHSKVAEEAVTGWEKAEAEVLALKKQVDATAQKNLVLEERTVHLDGALKECLRQLRLAREDQEQKILETISKTSSQWESSKSELEKQLAELRSELESAKVEALMIPDLRAQLESMKEENSVLKLELFSQAEELTLRTSERDLSTLAAETASKQHLESIRKVARLEGECRRLKALAHKAASANDQKSVAASSAYVESFTDSQSDSGERLSGIENDSRKMNTLEQNEYGSSRSDLWASALISELDQFAFEKPLKRNIMKPSSDMNLMDDFLEMERLAALPESDSESPLERGACSGELSLKVELEAMINRTAELEEKLENMESEKMKLEMALTQCQFQLKMSKGQLKETEVKLIELKSELALEIEARTAAEVEFQTTSAKLKKLIERLEKTEMNVAELQTKLDMAHEARKTVEAELKNTNLKLQSKLDMTHEARKTIEAELKDTNLKLQSKLDMAHEARKTLLAELKDTNLKLQKTEVWLEEAQVSLADLDAQFSTEREERIAAQQELEVSNSELKKSIERLEQAEANLLELQTQLERANEIRCTIESELEDSNAKREETESQLKAAEFQLQALHSRVYSLEEEVKKEQAFSHESILKLRKLESLNLRLTSQCQLQKATTIGEFQFNKDKELAVAASKFEECKKTIASIGRQLKTLSTLDDFLIDS